MAVLGYGSASASPSVFVVGSTTDAVDASPGDGDCAAVTGACRDATPAGRTISVDTTPPDTAITAGPVAGATVAATTTTFSFTAEQDASFECSLDGAAFAPCSSPRAYAGLAAGSHAFRVRAVDRAGNVDGTPAGRSWTVATPARPPETGGSGGGPPPAPVEHFEPEPMLVELDYTARVRRAGTTLRSLRLSGVPAGALVLVRCAGRSCPRTSLRIASTAGGVVKLKPFAGKRMRPGTKLTIRVTKAGLADAVLSLKLRARRPPRVTT